MSRIFILFFLTISAVGFSQRFSTHEGFLSTYGGITGKGGFFVSVDYNYVLNDRDWMVTGGILYGDQKAYINDKIVIDKIRLQHILGLVGISKSFTELQIDPVMLSVFTGGVAGYEIVNEGKNQLPNINFVSPNLKNSFVYGGAFRLQAKVEIRENVHFLLSLMEMYRTNSKIGQFTFYMGAGFNIFFD